MRVLVTGGLGYVGTVLVPYLAQMHEIRVYDSMLFGNSIADIPVEFVQGDMLSEPDLRHALDGCDAVIHLAGVVTDELVDMNPAYARKVNQHATAMLCAIAKEQAVKRLIYASSSSVYGTQDEVCTEESPTLPMTAYAESKLEAERICLSMASDALVISAVRSATCCGPAPRMRLDTIVNVFSKQAYYDGIITVHDGTQYRSNIHVRDAAELYGLLLETAASSINGQAFNAVRQFETALGIANRVQIQALQFGLQCEVRVDSTKMDNRQYRMSPLKAQRELAWWPSRSIDQAIRDNFRWFQSGRMDDPNADLYYNTRRMSETVRRG